VAPDAWNSGLAYEPFIGRWSRRVAAAFVPWLAVPSGGAWLDVGCGTGALAQAVLASGSPRLVVGTDPSAAYVAFAREHTHDARATFVTSDLPDLPATKGGFDAVVAGLVLNFVPSAVDAIAAMRARTRAGGVVSGYVWDYAEGMELLRHFWDAAIELDPAAAALDEGVRFPVCRQGALGRALTDAGLREVEERAIEVDTIFRDFDDFWTPLLGGQGPAPGYLASLAEEKRTALRDAIRSRLPAAADGTIALRARAWAARGSA
jgi:SAM-dependent methyltransferase